MLSSYNVHNIPLFHDEEQRDQACILPPDLPSRIGSLLKLYLVGGKYLMLTHRAKNPAELPRICLPVEDLAKAALRYALQRNLSQNDTRFCQGFCGYYTPSGLIHKVKLRVAPVQENQLAGGQRQDRHQRDAGGQQQQNGMLGGGDFMPIGGNLMLLPPQRQQQQLPPQNIMQALEWGRQQGRQQALQEAAAGIWERERQEERARLLEAERQEREAVHQERRDLANHLVGTLEQLVQEAKERANRAEHDVSLFCSRLAGLHGVVVVTCTNSHCTPKQYEDEILLYP
jgi:hypothetical protein